MLTRKDNRSRGGSAVRNDEARTAPNVRRPREEFGSINWGAAFFGWLVAMGSAAMLTAIVSAAGAATGLKTVSGSEATNTIGIGGGSHS